jgi:hypothetical protein
MATITSKSHADRETTIDQKIAHTEGSLIDRDDQNFVQDTDSFGAGV